MRNHLLLLLAGIVLGEAARAGDLPYGECRSGYWSSDRNLDDRGDIAKGTCLVNWNLELAEQTRLVLAARGGINDSARADGYSGRLREGYLETGNDAWRWRVGRQIIAWGRSDRINPTDYLAPRDLTLLVPEDDEQRLSLIHI